MTTVSYGAHESIQLALGEHTLLAPGNGARPHVQDPARAVLEGLAAPRNYPPLAAALAPGDHVAIALGKGVARLDEVLRGAIDAFVEAGVEPDHITVVTGEPLPTDAPLAVELAQRGVHSRVHDPDDENSSAMVGMLHGGLPLRFNRTLADADFVLLIASAKRASADTGAARYGGLYPRFSTRETADRFHGRHGAATPERTQRAAEADEAGWLLGVTLEVVVVPGPGGTVAAVVVGEPGTAVTEGAARFQEIWDRTAPRPGDLVIAAVAGDATEQTWSNVARAVAACAKVRSPEGAIAVCCEVADRPVGAFDKLVDAVDFGDVARRLRADAAADARAAFVLAQALEGGPVYLRSRLPSDVVESLGMTPIETDAELSRLAAGRRHCVVIEEAQHVRPRLAAAGGIL